MSYPVLYSSTATEFDNNGLGVLSSCISCQVVEEANGMFELSMEYPTDGIHFGEIGSRSIIKAKVDKFRDPQLFRVYSIQNTMAGVSTISAEHISYDLSGIPVEWFETTSVQEAMGLLKANSVIDHPFTFETDKISHSTFTVSVPSSLRSVLGDSDGGILDVYGGEYEFDNFDVKLWDQRGADRGMSVRYGKNLLDLTQERNFSSLVTGIYPFYAYEVDGITYLVTLPEKIVYADGSFDFTKIIPVDFSADFDERPSEERLRLKARNYITKNKIGVPVVSFTVSFAQLERAQEYKDAILPDRISLFDTVKVEFPALNVFATAKVAKMVHDVLSEKIESVTLGSFTKNVADTVSNEMANLRNLAKFVFRKKS